MTSILVPSKCVHFCQKSQKKRAKNRARSKKRPRSDSSSSSDSTSSSSSDSSDDSDRSDNNNTEITQTNKHEQKKKLWDDCRAALKVAFKDKDDR